MTTPFPYDHIQSRYAITDKLKLAVQNQPERDWSADPSAAIKTVNDAAKEFGFGFPYLPEQRSVATMLVSIFAGPVTAKICWKGYAAYLNTGILPPLR